MSEEGSKMNNAFRSRARRSLIESQMKKKRHQVLMDEEQQRMREIARSKIEQKSTISQTAIVIGNEAEPDCLYDLDGVSIKESEFFDDIAFYIFMRNLLTNREKVNFWTKHFTNEQRSSPTIFKKLEVMLQLNLNKIQLLKIVQRWMMVAQPLGYRDLHMISLVQKRCPELKEMIKFHNYKKKFEKINIDLEVRVHRLLVSRGYNGAAQCLLKEAGLKSESLMRASMLETSIVEMLAMFEIRSQQK